MATTIPQERSHPGSPQLPAHITAVGPQFPVSTGYYWIGQAKVELLGITVRGIVIYNAEECQFLYPEDALSVLYFLKSLEDTLLRQTRAANSLGLDQHNGGEHHKS